MYIFAARFVLQIFSITQTHEYFEEVVSDEHVFGVELAVFLVCI